MIFKSFDCSYATTTTINLYSLVIKIFNIFNIFFFYQAYDCLDKSWTCMTIFTTHNVKILSGATVFFWCLYNFLISSLYLRIHSSSEQYTLLKLSSLIIALGILNFGVAQRIKLKCLLTLNIGAIGIFCGMLIGIKWSVSIN